MGEKGIVSLRRHPMMMLQRSLHIKQLFIFTRINTIASFYYHLNFNTSISYCYYTCLNIILNIIFINNE